MKMIGIFQNLNLNENKMKEIEEWHYTAVKQLFDDSRVKLRYNKDKAGLLNELGTTTLRDLILASETQLSSMKTSLHHDKLNKYIVKSTRQYLFCHLYEKYRAKYGAELVRKLELSVCPYCNQNIISSTGKKIVAQFDHFYSKSKYPIFALSLYNLIPCCAVCNHLKLTNDVEISPYDRTYTTDKLIKFNYHPISEGKYAVDVKALEPKMSSNITQLQLKNRYDIHSNFIAELILKKKFYCDNYRRFWNNFLKQNGIPNEMSEEEIFYGNYLTEDKYYLRPLSKFTHDILEDLNSPNTQ